jgi:polysaccharide pyruvyl transferase WcaK-like protein
MKKLPHTICNTSLEGDNLGDKIIVILLKRNFPELFLQESGYFEVGTHDGNGSVSNAFLKRTRIALVTGGNSIPIKYLRPIRKNILNFSRKTLRNLNKKILFIGAGSENYTRGHIWSISAKYFLKKYSYPDIPHSVRDRYTENYLNLTGIGAVYTGCPTTWGLKKSYKNLEPNECVLTLTAHRRDIDKDLKIIYWALNKFNKVHFWPQQLGDIDYFNSLSEAEESLLQIEKLGFSLEALDNILSSGKVTHSIGTRLHGNLYSLNNNVLPIIVAIDNRAEELCKSSEIPFIRRNDVNGCNLDLFFNNLEVIKCFVPKKQIDEYKKLILEHI